MTQPALIDSLCGALTAVGIEPPPKIGLERPAHREHGDWSSNVTLATAKAAGRKPRDLTGEIAERQGLDLVGVAAPESM